jgi:hypothetical protein
VRALQNDLGQDLTGLEWLTGNVLSRGFARTTSNTLTSKLRRTATQERLHAGGAAHEAASHQGGQPIEGADRHAALDRPILGQGHVLGIGDDALDRGLVVEVDAGFLHRPGDRQAELDHGRTKPGADRHARRTLKGTDAAANHARHRRAQAFRGHLDAGRRMLDDGLEPVGDRIGAIDRLRPGLVLSRLLMQLAVALAGSNLTCCRLWRDYSGASLDTPPRRGDRADAAQERVLDEAGECPGLGGCRGCC